MCKEINCTYLPFALSVSKGVFSWFDKLTTNGIRYFATTLIYCMENFCKRTELSIEKFGSSVKFVENDKNHG